MTFIKQFKKREGAPRAHGFVVKKQFGQHFLREQSVVDQMIEYVEVHSHTSVLEIGCGDGFLTRSILETKIARLWIFEIDHDWATFVPQEYPDTRMTIFEENFLETDFERLVPHAPWTVLANLPYQITMPILRLFQQHRALFQEGVVMVQEEFAQKIVKKSGRGFGYVALFFQHYFEWKLLQKISPAAFYPPPKVHSRLLYFKPLPTVQAIPEEEGFWKFIRACFSQPRRTLRNCLEQFSYDMALIPSEQLAKRAEQLAMSDFLALWEKFRVSVKIQNEEFHEKYDI